MPDDSHHDPPVRRRWWRRLARGSVALAVTGLVGALIGGWFGRAWWALDLFNHFQVQYLAVAGLALMASLLLRMRLASVVSAVVMVVFAIRVVPWFVGAPDSDGRPALRVVLFNVLKSNPRHDEVYAYLARIDADIIVLEEVGDAWMTAMAPLRDTHPHVVAAPRNDDFGIAMFSRVPIDQGRVRYFGSSGVPSIEGRVDIGGPTAKIPATIIATHPVPPVTPRRAGLRDEQLAVLATRVRAIDGPVIVIGDLNATMWSTVYADFIDTTELRDTRRGFGVQPTWSQRHPWWLRIPIDHCLVSDGVEVVSWETGPGLGSDHLPVVVELGD